MIYRLQINWAKAYNYNFDDGSSWLLQNSLINLLFTSTLNLLEWMKKYFSVVRTTIKLWQLKTVGCKILAMYYSFDLFVSFEIISIDFFILLDVLDLLIVLTLSIVNLFIIVIVVFSERERTFSLVREREQTMNT